MKEVLIRGVESCQAGPIKPKGTHGFQNVVESQISNQYSMVKLESHM